MSAMSREFLLRSCDEGRTSGGWLLDGLDLPVEGARSGRLWRGGEGPPEAGRRRALAAAEGQVGWRRLSRRLRSAGGEGGGREPWGRAGRRSGRGRGLLDGFADVGGDSVFATVDPLPPGSTEAFKNGARGFRVICRSRSRRSALALEGSPTFFSHLVMVPRDGSPSGHDDGVDRGTSPRSLAAESRSNRPKKATFTCAEPAPPKTRETGRVS